MAAVSLKDVRKSYGKTEVVHGVSIDIDDGEFIVIVGPSGCGKSTLLRMVAGLERISSGTISIGGRVVNDVEPKDRDIAMVFQNYALYPHMTVRENMAYGLKISGMSRPDIDERIAATARMLQLEPYLARRPRELSGGQRQRVAMGRALVREPATFLLDEPLSNLDAKLRVQMRLEIREMQRAVGVTSLYVTHDQVEAMTLADRLVVMNAGVAEQIDTPLAVYRHPQTVFVAGFIGSPAMNLIPASLFEAAGAGAFIEQILAATGAGAPRGDDLLIGLRPEDVMLLTPDQADLSIAVHAVEVLGADTMVHGRVQATGSGPVAAPSDLVVRLPGNTVVNIGDHLPVRFDRDAVHRFDRVSGRRL